MILVAFLDNVGEHFLTAALTSIPWAVILFRRDKRVDQSLVIKELQNYIKQLKRDIKEIRKSERRCQHDLGQVREFLMSRYGVAFPPMAEEDEESTPHTTGKLTDDDMPTPSPGEDTE